MSSPSCHVWYLYSNSLQVNKPQNIAYLKMKTNSNSSVFYIQHIGDILVALGQPQELAPFINQYSRFLIPYIFLTGYTAVFMRLLQSLDLNIGLTYCCLISISSSPLFVWLFMYPLGMGYLGAAMGQIMVLFMFCLTQFTYLVYKGLYEMHICMYHLSILHYL